MLHTDQEKVRRLLFKGCFGLEKENLRVTGDGYFSHTPDPFSDEKHIDRDFCENQVEINTEVVFSPAGAVQELNKYDRKIREVLSALPEREYLWPFSNPPYIRSEKDIPIAQYYGERASKTEYRNYLSDRYGRYKMTFSGIHFNYSFSEELLRADYEVYKAALSNKAESDHGLKKHGCMADTKSKAAKDCCEIDTESKIRTDSCEKNTGYRAYKDQLYVTLAERAAAYGWIMVAVTAASPLLDSSYVSKNDPGRDLFNGMATTRCSELGYWNSFTPVFDYTSVEKYADSILQYVHDGLLKYPSELYYPIRLKPAGTYNLEHLKRDGVDHIELRMIDLNPLCESGIEEKDVFFAQLLLIWLASTPRQPFTMKDQVQAVQNFKNAARFDLKTVKIVVQDGEVYSVARAAIKVLEFMEEFYQELCRTPEVSEEMKDRIRETLAFQKDKFIHPENRYAWRVYREFQGGYVQKGLQLIKRESAEE